MTGTIGFLYEIRKFQDRVICIASHTLSRVCIATRFTQILYHNLGGAAANDALFGRRSATRYQALVHEVMHYEQPLAVGRLCSVERAMLLTFY